MNEIERNILLINEKINKACLIYQRNKREVNLIAVSKTMNCNQIKQAIESGCSIFGENYIKEAKEKWPQIKELYSHIKLHFIGHLQSNKVKDAVSLFDCIETLDSKKLAQEIAKESIKQNKKIECFVQINIGQELQKGGIDPLYAEEFIQFCRDEQNLNIVGLMCIPPSDKNASPYFALMAKIARKLNIKYLSMGMSQDFEHAIAIGSTHIRLGSAIFGQRLIANK